MTLPSDQHRTSGPAIHAPLAALVLVAFGAGSCALVNSLGGAPEADGSGMRPLDAGLGNVPDSTPDSVPIDARVAVDAPIDAAIDAPIDAPAVAPNYMFVTSTTTTGNMGGLAGADGICQSRAAAAGLAGTYRAWLSTTTTDAKTRIAGASGWIRTDGKPFANMPQQVDNAQFYYPPRLDELGHDLLSARVHTATTQGGVLSPSSTCSNWTSATTAEVPMTGNTASSGAEWTAAGSAFQCASALHLYCFGIDRTASVTVPLPTGNVRRAFMMIWTPGGGIAAADSSCQSTAQSAGLTGTYRALLASAGVSALSRFDLNGARWYRVDNVPILPSASAWSTAMYFDATPNLTASGSMTFGNYGNWTGISSLTTPGTAASTCNSWTDQTASAAVGSANSNLLARFYGNEDTLQCNFTSGTITCLQI